MVILWVWGTLRVGASDGGGTGYEVNDYLTVDTNLSILNKWQCRQIIWDRDNGEIRNHINGILQDTGDISSLTNSLYDGSGATIGTLYGWYHYGDRSLTKIYNRVLLPTELQQNYNALKKQIRTIMYTGPHIVTDQLVLAMDAASKRSYPGTGNYLV